MEAKAKEEAKLTQQKKYKSNTSKQDLYTQSYKDNDDKKGTLISSSIESYEIPDTISKVEITTPFGIKSKRKNPYLKLFSNKKDLKKALVMKEILDKKF